MRRLERRATTAPGWSWSTSLHVETLGTEVTAGSKRKSQRGREGTWTWLHGRKCASLLPRTGCYRPEKRGRAGVLLIDDRRARSTRFAGALHPRAQARGSPDSQISPLLGPAHLASRLRGAGPPGRHNRARPRGADPAHNQPAPPGGGGPGRRLRKAHADRELDLRRGRLLPHGCPVLGRRHEGEL